MKLQSGVESLAVNVEKSVPFRSDQYGNVTPIHLSFRNGVKPLRNLLSAGSESIAGQQQIPCSLRNDKQWFRERIPEARLVQGPTEDYRGLNSTSNSNRGHRERIHL
jgi:hypothetical protein